MHPTASAAQAATAPPAAPPITPPSIDEAGGEAAARSVEGGDGVAAACGGQPSPANMFCTSDAVNTLPRANWKSDTSCVASVLAYVFEK